MKKTKGTSLAWQIFYGLILGIIVGWIFYVNPTLQLVLEPIGDIFLRLIKMIVIPIVITSIVVAIASSGDVKQLGKLGGKTLLYFEIITTLAIIVGIVSANLFKPGAGVDFSSLTQGDISKYVHTANSQKDMSLIDTIVHIVPTNPFAAIANGDMLAIIFFSVIFGLGLSAVGESAKPVTKMLKGAADTMFHITHQIMRFAPIGVFALIGITVAKYGIASLIPLGKLILVIYVTMFFFVIVILGAVAKIFGYSIFSLISLIKDEIILAFSTASSETVLPRLIEKVESIGVPKHISSFVIPTGYSFNLDGSTLYQAIAAIFIAQMYNIDFPIAEQISLVLILMVTSKGIAGVPGVSIVVLVTTLGIKGLPVQGLAYIVGIDRILDMGRTAVNVIGNGLAAVIIAKWQGEFAPKKVDQ
ncbi:cation:dicarboxylate symporter family transporter [Thorsellia anophelis]|uniref:Proton glutamate symport protein n=1 Tax=Thorsellia anophelis DSM 18579 TaxID=1123402 RepID=A0A1I0CHT5_9GAMM|nr:cation:dicarboxylase symporter family transporter [Thorsellia anophelis]SET19154.1 proton glutamate symport protein [Thorsellia anophelis DSM 18579]